MAARFPPDLSRLLTPYFDAVGAVNPDHGLHFYPGSPLVTLTLMRRNDRLLACELEPGEAAALAHHLGRDRRAKAIAIDGWVALNAYVPPKERRGLVLIDPPFEQRDDFERLARALVAAWRKWSTGIFLVWYPIKDRSGPDALAAAISAAAIPAVLRAELAVSRQEAGRLSQTGVIVVNPPWHLAEELQQLMPALADVMAGAGGTVRVDWLGPDR